MRHPKAGHREGRAQVTHSTAPAFSLMEVLVSLAVFSLAAGLAFSILSRSAFSRDTAKGYMEAVILVDGFLQERRRRADAADYFFGPETVDMMRDGVKDLNPESLETAIQDYVVTNEGIVYTLSCRPEILTMQPFVFRGRVACRWMIEKQGRQHELRYRAATVFTGVQTAEVSNVRP